jgi:hypothetical protein
MPLPLNRVDQKILWIAAVAFVVLVVVAWLVVAPDNENETIPSTYASGSFGAKAAFLLLQETGYHVERWEQPLKEIGTGKNKTLILAEPSLFYANDLERGALDKFIGSGGRLIAIGPSVEWLLPRLGQQPYIGFNPARKIVWEKFPARAPSEITHAASQIAMVPQASWQSSTSALILYGTEKDSVVVTYPYGEGKVIWWAATTPLTNAGIKEPGNLEFFLACLGDKNTVQILWDEYYHGFSRSAKATYESKLSGGLAAQLALLAVAILWTFSRRSGPLRPAAPEVRLSPLEFVETLGGLYEHAHASPVAVDICYQRFLYWVAKRLGMSTQASLDDLELAARSRWPFLDKQFGSVVRECASARYLPSLQPQRALQLIRSLHSYAAQLELFPKSSKEKS